MKILASLLMLWISGIATGYGLKKIVDYVQWGKPMAQCIESHKPLCHISDVEVRVLRR